MKNSRTLRLIFAFLKIAFGSAVYATGFQFFIYPNAIPAGGLTGIAMIINYITGLPIGVLVIVMNIPLFLYAWRKFGVQFIAASLLGMLLSSTLVDVFAGFSITATSEMLLACIYGGIINGFGLGLVYSAGGTTGGVDIIARLLRKLYPYVNIGTFVLMLDIVVIAVFAVIFGKYDSAMYGVITMFVVSKLIDLVLYGVVNTKSCYIITDMGSEISEAITKRMVRGVTLLKGEGAWSGREKKIILCAIKTQQIVELKRIVREFDETAFVIVSDAREVFGQGFMSIDGED